MGKFVRVFIWKWKYALRIARVAGFKMWWFGWYCAGEHLTMDTISHKTDCPIQSADDEMSYWYD